MSCREWSGGVDTDALFHLSSLQTDATSKVSHRHHAGLIWMALVRRWPLAKCWAEIQEAGLSVPFPGALR